MADLARCVAWSVVCFARSIATAFRVSALVAAATLAYTATVAPLANVLGVTAHGAAISPASALTSQTITFGALANKTYGAAPFTVSATASSGLTVTFTSLTAPVCTVSGTTVTIVAAGTCTIRASQAGNATYAPAPNVSQSFTVAKAAQTITFGALSGKTYGVAPFAVSATASSGLAVTFVSTTTAVCTVSGSTVTIVTGGTCTIQAQQAGNGNYNAATNVNQSFTVAKAAQTITFGALSGKTYGVAPFAVSATASSGLAVTFVSTTTAVCTVSGSTVTIVTGGTCTIQAQQAGNANYNAAPNVNQSFTVAKAAQTITFAALANKTYGVAPFAVSATASSGLAVTFASATTTVCTVSANTVTIVTSGTCSVKASQAGNTSYLAATAVTQSFTVAKANQTITFAALAAQTYGVAPFAVSATASSKLAVTFTSTTTTVCTVSSGTVTIKAAGTCTIQAAQAGNSSYNAAPNVSQSFSVAKANQTITFAALANQTYGVAPIGLTATASSGLAVAFSSLTTTVCAVGGATMTIVAAGTCTVQASQAGNSGYNAAPNVSQSFTVAKANQTIAFGALASQTYGVAPFDLSATASSGLWVGFSSLTIGACAVSGVTVTVLAAGTCTIQATQAGSSGYNAAPNVSQSFTIGKASQTITFGAIANQNYGAVPFAVTLSASSGLTVLTSSLTTSVCTVSDVIVTLVAAGTCTIQATQPGDANYNAATSVSQTFSVGLTSQTISFLSPGNQLISAGTVWLTATASSGLVVTLSSLTPAVCTLNASPATLVSPGTCTIQATQPGNAGYSPAPSVNQSFIVFGVPQFASPVSYATGSFPSGLAAGDFNTDGKTDLAVANAFFGNVSILLGSGNGTLAQGAAVQVGGQPTAVAVGDFNGDGKLDLAVADFYGNTIIIVGGNGNGTFALLGSYNAGPGPISIATADLNGDGKLDLVVTNSPNDNAGHTLTVFLGNGDGTFHAGVSYATGPNPSAVVIVDFNGDGKPDLAVANGGSNSVSILLGRGDGTFAPAVNYAADSYPDALAVADFNGDGKVDLAVANNYSADVSILLGRGDGTFGTATNFSAGSGPSSVAVGDFNGDGIADVAVANRFDNTVSVLLGNGDGTFWTPLTYNVGAHPNALIAKDLNGDGKTDLVVANAYDNTVSVLMQLATLPASLSLVSGSPQSATVGTAYATAFAVLVKDAGGHPLSGASVTFAAPSTGASGIFSGSGATVKASSNAIGVATAPTFTANATAGSFTVTASVGALNATFALTNTAIVTQAPAFTSAPPPNGAINVAYSYTATATGAPAPTFSVTSGALPPGLALNAATGVLAGTPSATGTFAGTLTATNGIAPAATQAFSISITAAPQVIAFGALANQIVGMGSLSLSATASSGLPVSFASLTPAVCTLVSNVVAFTTAGTCTIRASQPGNASYAPAPNVDQSFAIIRSAQTISFAALSSAAVNSGVELRATASSGLPVAFSSLTSAVCVVSGNMASLIAAGTCTVRASQPGDAGYSAAPSVDRSFAVTLASQMITFWPIGDRGLQASPVFVSATASSGLPVTFSSLTPAVCTVTGSSVTLLAAGTCTVRADQGGSSTYAASFAVQNFVVMSGAGVASSPPTITGPFVEYSTYLGGDGNDKAFDVVVGPDGSAYVAGSVASTNFPGLNSATFTDAGLDLLYVAKINPNRGSLDFSTVVGGRAPDITLTGLQAYVGSFQTGAPAFLGAGQVEAVAIDQGGNVYVAAYANSTDYPMRGGSYARSGPKYIFKIAPTGSVQRLSAAIDPAVMTVRALALDAMGGLYFTGVAGPGLITSPGAVIPIMPTPTSAFGTLSAPYLIKLAPGGTTTAFATYLSTPGSRSGTLPSVGQSLIDAATTAYALTVDAAGNSYVAGQATAVDFPVTTGSPDTSDTKNRDAFVVKVNPNGTAIPFVARLGGSDAERATSIALSPDGGIVIGGKTATLPFSGTFNAFQTQVYFEDQTPLVERETGFVAKLSADGKQWTLIEPLGTIGGNLVLDAFVGDVDPYPVKVAVDAAGAIYAAGTTFSDRRLANLDTVSILTAGWLSILVEQIVPATNDLAAVASNGAFVMKISPDGSRPIYVATLGLGIATGLAIDGFGNAFVTGYAGDGIPVVNANQATPNFGDEQTTPFVAKINDRLAPLKLVSNKNPGDTAQPVNLVATVADARYAGAIEFDDGATVLGTAALSGGIATFPANLAAGIHRLRAIFHGSGPFDGYASSEVIQVVNQAPASQ